MSQIHSLQISPASGATALTPGQKRFNTLIRQIEQARRRLAAWRDNVALYAQAHVRTVVPLDQELSALRREWVFALDRLLDQPGWSKSERATVSELICEGAGPLLEEADGDDAALKALFDKHGEIDFETGQQESRAALKRMTEAMTGIDMGDVSGLDSEADWLQRLQAGLAGQIESEAAQAEQQAAAAPGRRGRKKTAAQQKREAEAQLATQSVREVFRKLASALHPDRETDPAERAAKTALMQKVNQAYAANDLLVLLELQLQIEQVDAGHLAGADAQRIKHYNKVLTEQLAELKMEIDATEMRFRMDFGLQAGLGLDPTRLLRLVDENAADLRTALAIHRRDLRTFDDKAATRRWIKREHKRMREEMLDDDFFF
jgi:hypothetical protein